jgi:uncharacterized protein (TIGR03083 family)
VVAVAAGQWERSRAALQTEVARVTALLRSVDGEAPSTPTVGTWDLTDIAVHLSHAWQVMPGKSRGDGSAFADLTAGRGAAMPSIWDLREVTASAVKADPERDLTALADRIDTCAEAYFAACAGQVVEETHGWMVEGVDLPQSVFTGHLLNETVVHGYDIARAAGRPWRLDPAHCALVIEGFIVRLLQTFEPTTFVTERAAGVHATFELRLRGGGRYHFRFRDGVVRVGPPEGPVDCYLSADPGALLLVIFARRSQWEAIGRGRLLAWGRKPWLGLRFKGFLQAT